MSDLDNWPHSSASDGKNNIITLYYPILENLVFTFTTNNEINHMQLVVTVILISYTYSTVISEHDLMEVVCQWEQLGIPWNNFHHKITGVA